MLADTEMAVKMITSPVSASHLGLCPEVFLSVLTLSPQTESPSIPSFSRHFGLAYCRHSGNNCPVVEK